MKEKDMIFLIFLIFGSGHGPWFSWFSCPPQWFWNLLPEKRSLAHSSSHRLLPKMYLLSFHRLATTFTSHCNCPHQHASYCSQWCSFKLPARFLNKPLQMFASTCILLQPVVFIQVPCSYFRSYFGSPITILHCLQTNLIEAVYFYPLITFAEPATSEVQSLFFTVYKQTWLKRSTFIH